MVDYDLSLGLDPRLLREVGDLIAPQINKTHHALVDYDLSLGLDPRLLREVGDLIADTHFNSFTGGS